MKPPSHIDPKLAALLRKAAPMREEERARQVVRLAYGNVKLENERATIAQAEQAAKVVTQGETIAAPRH